MRAILKASAVMGVSSVVTVLMSIVRQKLIALTLGPEGIGLLGLLATGLALATTVFSVGLASSGVRYVARAKEAGDDELARTRSALLYGSQLLGLVGGLGFVIFRQPLAGLILGGNGAPAWIVWLGVGVWATVVSGGQLAVINGLRRIGALAGANIFGALVGTAATVTAVWLGGDAGLIAAIVAPPLATWAAAWWLSRDVPLLPLTRHARPLWRTLRPLLGLGLVFSLSFLLGSVVQFLSRVVVERVLGLEAAGYFQAAWSVSKVYLGFVLTALAAEYYPRISTLSHELDKLNRAVVYQMRSVLLLAGPVILGMILFAPLAVRLLYSADFGATVAVLRWQLAGDVPKVAGWSLGFLLLAREARLKYFLSELVWNGLYLASLVVLLPIYGLIVTGIMYAVSYVVYLLLVLWLARAESGLRIDRGTAVYLVLLSAVSLAVALLASLPSPLALVTAAGLSLLVTAYALIRIKRDTDFSFRRLRQKISGGGA